MRISRTAGIVPSLCVAALMAAVGAPAALGQCQLLVRETFRPGDRPHGGNGRLRNAAIHDTLTGYWPQLPAATQWITANQSGVATWAFAGSSLDPAEVDALDPYNGTAFGEAPAAALLPFIAPTGPVTVSAEAVMGLGSTSTTYLGFTSNPATASNFETFGSLWMSLDGSGNWSIRANGNAVIASGTAPIVGTLDSGWLHMEFTYDPASQTVSGRVMETTIAPLPVTLARPLSYIGMEAHNSWNVLNNLSVFTGSKLTASAAITSGTPCLGQSVTLTGSTNAAPGAQLTWRKNGWPLTNGPQTDGSIVTGANSATLMLTATKASDAGSYDLVVASECGSVISPPITLTLASCGCSIADVARQGGAAGGDGQLTVDDLIFYLGEFFTDNRAVADIAGLGGTAGPDGQVSVDDLVIFISAFFAGCQ